MPAGNFGQVLFGVVIWAASVTSVIGAAYFSFFLNDPLSTIERNRNRWIIAFIVISTVVLVTVKTCCGISLCGNIKWLNTADCDSINFVSCLQVLLALINTLFLLAFSGWFLL